MKVLIIGQGYVGLSVAVYAAEHYQVVGFDTNPKIVENLNLGFSHIEGITSKKLQEILRAKKFYATSKIDNSFRPDVVVICVPTPLDSKRNPDLSFIESACKTIAENIENSALIINESTSYPGTLRNFIKPTIESYSKNKVEHKYAISPERVDPGREDYDQKNTPRLIAGLDSEATNLTKAFYSKFCDHLVEVSNPEVAEAAKLFENTFRQVNIALVNEFAQITNAIGLNVHETLEAANTKPFGFMKFTPGAGVGGHCIPVDPTYLADIAESHGVKANFIRLANEVNIGMSKYIVNRIYIDHEKNLKDKLILVVGIAYKPNVADVRETPAELVIKYLREFGAIVSWHDEVVKTWKGEKSAPLYGSDITIVLTKHSSVDSNQIMKSAPYIFDTTGSIPYAKGL